MSSSNPSRFLNDASGTEYALALRQNYGLGVVEAFRDDVILLDTQNPAVIRKIISQGKSHQFLMMADTPEPDDHVPGDELLGQQFAIDEGNITLDGIVVSHHDVPIDQMEVSSEDIIGPLSRKTGSRIARAYDSRLMRKLILTARGASVTKNGLSVHGGGNRSTVSNATFAGAFPVTSGGADAFHDSAQELAESMDNDNVPEDGRLMYIPPYIRRVLMQKTSIFEVMYAQGSSDNNLQKRKIGKLAGFDVIVAKNRIPTANVATGPTKYQGTFVGVSGNSAVGQVAAVVACGAGYGVAPVGVVQMGGIKNVTLVDERRNTVFLKSQIFMGADSLHPWCAGTIEQVAP